MAPLAEESAGHCDEPCIARHFAPVASIGQHSRCRRGTGKAAGLSARQLGRAVWHRGYSGSPVSAHAGVDECPRFHRNALCAGAVGPLGAPVPCIVPVTPDGRQRCVPDRRHLQSFRLFRGVARRVLRAGAARFRRRPDQGRPALCDDQCRNLAVVSVWRKPRSEEHTSELQSLMRILYAAFCLKKKKKENAERYITDICNIKYRYYAYSTITIC